MKSGAVRPLDTTCPAVYAGLQAGEKGIPFMPLRGLIGSDILTHRGDYKVVDNPLAPPGEADPVVLVPALRPDLALIHAPLADREGNLWIGRDHELRIWPMPPGAPWRRRRRCSRAIFSRRSAARGRRDPGALRRCGGRGAAGAQPLGMAGLYDEDPAAIAAYVRAAETRLASAPGWTASWRAADSARRAAE